MSDATAGEWVIAGEKRGAMPVAGDVYDVRHSRKGAFRLRVTGVSGVWLTGTILKGSAKAIYAYNVREEGESITIRDVHSYLLPILRGERAPGPTEGEGQ